MPANELLFREYTEINAHLRANITQFVNWFSFFLTFSFASVAAFLAAVTARADARGFPLTYGVQIVFLLMHVLAFVSILTFRRYIVASHCRLEAIIRQIAEPGDSPVPVRFSKWMTDLMAAGFVLSYFTWFSLLFLR
ncbi:MAG: hypothetical protein JOZ42_01640 [Acetobacteraceae bacterium]|nr:hypothetical protein [Acetobacteraceae bacterium]